MAKSTKATIKVTALESTPLEDSGNVLGIYTIGIERPPLEIRKCLLVQQPGHSPYASPPQETYIDHAGKRRYITLIKWPAEWSKPILEVMLAAQRDHPDGIKRTDGTTFGVAREGEV